eukprot:PhM_4_TR8203/c0_g1_i1/m.15825/K14857/SPB1, FTSJ3; AdoMet-dependent rRNA methyltransferase SPB1
MGKNKQKAKDRLDKFYDLAKQQGYRARSAFKLVQLNRKYGFLNKANTVVDLCAAPGGWMQVCAKHMPVTSTIVGVDLVAIKPIAGCKSITGDIYADKTRKEILNALKGQKAEVVLHDGAPNVGGVWAREAFAQHQLVLQACKLACQVLQPGGWFVTKVFRAEEYNTVIWVMKQLFEKVEATKPLASRMESAEVFVTCQGFKAPKKLDPKFFKASEVFAEVNDVEAVMQPDGTMRKPVSKVPQGFDKMGAQFSPASITDFLATRDPRGFLDYFSEIRFDAQDEDEIAYKRSTHTTKEMLHLCTDLRQVSEADKRRMLKWRERLQSLRSMRNKEKGIEEDLGPVADEHGAAHTTGVTAVSDDEQSSAGSVDEAELEQQLADIHLQKLKDKKKRDERIVNRKLRHLGRVLHYDPENVDGGGEDEMLGGVAGAELTAEDFDENWDIAIERPMDAMVPLANKNLDDDDDDDSDFYNEDDDDSDEEERNSNDGPEEGHADLPNPKRLRKNFYDNMESILDETFPKANLNADRDAHKKKKRKGGKGEEDVVEMHCDDDLRGDEDESRKAALRRLETLDDDEDGSDDDYESFDEDDNMANFDREAHKGGQKPRNVEQATLQALTKAQRKEVKSRRSGTREGGFEEIPAALSDPEMRARTLAIATKMLDKKSRRDILEGAIHKFAHHEDDLPDWFTREEQRHYFRPIPVTKEEIDFQRDRFKEINMRPSKKVAEAIGRKRRRAQRILRGVQKKGNSDPKMKEKGDRLSIRRLMRSKTLNPIHKKSMDNKMKGERTRAFQKAKRSKK